MTVTPTTRRSRRPLVVAVEGRCYAGKTTLIRHLAPLVDAVAVAEYADLAPLPPWPPVDRAAVTVALAHFLTIEQDRAARVRSAGAPIVLLDRSPLTLIAHEYAMTAVGVPADPAAATDLYAAAAQDGSILTPDAYLHLAVPDPVTAARRSRRGPVDPHLDHPAVRARLDHVYRTWLQLLPARRRLLLDGATAPVALARRAAAFLATVRGPAPPSWRALADDLAAQDVRRTA